MIEKINLFSNISFNSNKIEKKKNVETQNAAELPKSFSVPSGKLLHSYMVSFGAKSKSVNNRWQEIKDAMTPKAEEVYVKSKNLAKQYKHGEIKQIHTLKVINDMMIESIDKIDKGDLDAIDDNLYTSPMSLKDRFGEDIFKDEKQRKVLKEALVEESKILDKKLKEMPKNGKSGVAPQMASDYIKDIYRYGMELKSDETSMSDELIEVTDRCFYNTAIWPTDEKVNKELSKPFMELLSKKVMTDRTEKPIPLKFYNPSVKKIWDNLSVGTNMFIVYEKNQKFDYMVDSFVQILKDSKDGIGKFNKKNTEVNRYSENVNTDFMLSEVKRGIKDKKKNHVYIFDYDSICTNESDEGVDALEQYIKEAPKYPNLKFVITTVKKDYYDSILAHKDAIYKDFSQVSIPRVNMDQAKKMFKEEKALTADFKKDFSKNAIDKVIEAVDKLDGFYPAKAQKVLKLIATYYPDKKEIHKQDVTKYIGEAKEIFKIDDKNKSSVQVILNTETKLKDLVGLKATRKEAESIVRQIKDHSIGTKGYIVYSQDGTSGSGRNYTAKAIAGEAKIPFLEINAVDFGTKDVDIFGESSTSPEIAMKNLFSMAKTQAETNPHKALVLYIQNFEYFSCGDQVSEYHEKAMSQLLREMNIAQKQGLNIVVMGSVSNQDLIGESTTKSFKFVDKIEIESPRRNKQSRKELIDFYLKKKGIKLDAKTPEEKEALVTNFAQMTEYFPLITIMTLLDKVKNVSKERGHKATDKADFIEAYMQIECGRPSVNEITKFSKEITTCHECGHAINETVMNEITKSINPWAESNLVSFITLDPRSNYLGAVYPSSPDNDEYTFERVFAHMVCAFGGYSCENKFYGINGSYGITGDMEHVTDEATTAVAIMGQGHYFGKKSVNAAAFLDDKDKENINKDINVFMKNAELVSDLIVKNYAGFIKQFTEKYSPKVGTGECIVSGDTFRQELAQWRSTLSDEEKEKMRQTNEAIKAVMKAAQNGIICKKAE